MELVRSHRREPAGVVRMAIQALGTLTAVTLAALVGFLIAFGAVMWAIS